MNDLGGRSFLDLAEHLLSVFAGDGDELAIDIDAIAVDGIDLIEGDGKAAVYPGELIGGELIGYFGEGLIGDPGVAGCFDTDIILEAFDIEDIAEEDLYELLIHFQEEVFGGRGLGRGGKGGDGPAELGELFEGLHKAGEIGRAHV